MNRTVRTPVFSMVFALASLAGIAQDKVVITCKAAKGQVVRYHTQGTLQLTVSGQKLKLEISSVERHTVVNVSASGDITWEHTTESRETTVNGEKQPADVDKTVSTIVVHTNGSLVSFKTSSGDVEAARSAVRLRSAASLIFTTRPVGVGDKWTSETKADPALGLVEAKADYEVVGADKLNGIDCFKVKMAYRETKTTAPTSATATIWVEKSSGDAIATDVAIENAHFGDKTYSPATGTGHSNRTDGSPLGNVKQAAETETNAAPKL